MWRRALVYTVQKSRNKKKKAITGRDERVDTLRRWRGPSDRTLENINRGLGQGGGDAGCETDLTPTRLGHNRAAALPNSLHASPLIGTLREEKRKKKGDSRGRRRTYIPYYSDFCRLRSVTAATRLRYIVVFFVISDNGGLARSKSKPRPRARCICHRSALRYTFESARLFKRPRSPFDPIPTKPSHALLCSSFTTTAIIFFFFPFSLPPERVLFKVMRRQCDSLTEVISLSGRRFKFIHASVIK